MWPLGIDAELLLDVAVGHEGVGLQLDAVELLAECSGEVMHHLPQRPVTAPLAKSGTGSPAGMPNPNMRMDAPPACR